MAVMSGGSFVGPALWNGTRHIDRASLPSYAVMLVDHVSGLIREERTLPRRSLLCPRVLCFGLLQAPEWPSAVLKKHLIELRRRSLLGR